MDSNFLSTFSFENPLTLSEFFRIEFFRIEFQTLKTEGIDLGRYCIGSRFEDRQMKMDKRGRWVREEDGFHRR